MALATAACQSGSGGIGELLQPTSVAAPPTSPPPASPPPTGTSLNADNYLLTEGPITAGFTASPAEAQANSDRVSVAGVAGCLGVPENDRRDEYLDSADGPKFTSDADAIVTITSSATVVSAEKAAADLALLRNPRFADCFSQALQAEFDRAVESGTAIEIVAVETPEPPAGAQALLRISMGVTVRGETIGLVLDNLFFIEGQVEVTVNYTNVDNNPSPEHLQRIADQIAGKLQIQ